jgi:hypothetical protein
MLSTNKTKNVRAHLIEQTHNQAGKYIVCVKSDDGSHVLVDGTEMAAMPGLHPPQEGCGERQLEAGDHPVSARFFENGGDSYFEMTYRGPDTDNKVQALPSSSLPECKSPEDKCPCGAGWCTKWYFNPLGTGELQRIPEVNNLVPQMIRVVPTIALNNDRELTVFLNKDGEFSQVVGVFTGVLTVNKPGKYTLCTSSDDGSHLYADGDEVVDNGGLHGEVKKCGDMDLETGDHRLRVTFFQNRGGAMVRVTYSGPDTDGKEALMPSSWHSSDVCGRNPNAPPETCDCTGGKSAEPQGECKDFKSLGYKKCNQKPGCKSFTACG